MVFHTDIVKSILSSFSHMENCFVFILFRQSEPLQMWGVFFKVFYKIFIYIAKFKSQDLKLSLQIVNNICNITFSSQPWLWNNQKKAPLDDLRPLDNGPRDMPALNIISKTWKSVFETVTSEGRTVWGLCADFTRTSVDCKRLKQMIWSKYQSQKAKVTWKLILKLPLKQWQQTQKKNIFQDHPNVLHEFRKCSCWRWHHILYLYSLML